MKFSILCSLVFILLHRSNILSQNDYIVPDSTINKNFEEIEDLYYNNDGDTSIAKKYLRLYFKKAIINRDTLKMLKGKLLESKLFYNDNIYLNFCDSLISVYTTNPSKKFPAYIHSIKVNFYYEQKKNKELLVELFKAEKLLNKIKNDSLHAINLYYLGIINASINENKKACGFLKKSYCILKKNKKLTNNNLLLSLPLNLAVNYNNLNELDSTYKYFNESIRLYKKLEVIFFLGYTYYSKALIEQKKGLYNQSINSLKIVTPFIIENEDYPLLASIYNLTARSYKHLNKNKLAKYFHLKTDSLCTEKKIKNKYYKSSLMFLLGEAQKNKNLLEELEYIQKILEVEKTTLSKKNNLQKIFTDEFDIPMLKENKDNIELLLLQEKKQNFTKSILFVISVFTIILAFFKQLQKKRVYKKRFLAIVNQENFINPKLSSKEKTTANKPKLSNSIVTAILKELDTFEKEEVYLQSDNSLQNLANKLNTNANYLSKVINQHKNTTFSNYINKLRIEYAVKRLKKDPLWRKYTIKAIATEVGFKNAESFSKAFVKFTELKPSYFIKNLEK